MTGRKETRIYGQWWCVRCGLKQRSDKIAKSRMCTDCRTVENTPAKQRETSREVPSRTVGLEKPCLAWLRAFDDDDNPILPDGSYVAPGARLCGHRDCVEPTHIVVAMGSAA